MNRDNWATGPELFAVIKSIWHPGIDVCADRDNHKCARYKTIEQDALRDGNSWGRAIDGDFYFCNAPGSKIAEFMAKAFTEQDRGARGVFIFQAGISAKWFRGLTQRAIVHPLTPRPNFVIPPGVETKSGRSVNDRDWMLAVLEPWMAALPSACGIGLPFAWEEAGVARGVLHKPSAHRRAVVAVTGEGA